MNNSKEGIVVQLVVDYVNYVKKLYEDKQISYETYGELVSKKEVFLQKYGLKNKITS